MSRSSDLAAHYTDEEIVCTLPYVGCQGVFKVADHIRERVVTRHIKLLRAITKLFNISSRRHYSSKQQLNAEPEALLKVN